MLSNNLKQKDLLDIFGTPSIVSEVLTGKRNLTTEHIRRLSQRFHVSPEYFSGRPLRPPSFLGRGFLSRRCDRQEFLSEALRVTLKQRLHAPLVG